MRRWVPVALMGALALGGCATAATPEQIAAADDAQCVSLGVSYGSPGYPDCRLRVAALRQQDAQARALRMMAVGQALQNAGAAMKQNQPTHTTCTRNGPFVNCDTY